MFVQALAAYADKNLQKELNDVAFEERAVPYWLEVSADGSFLGVRERFEPIASKPGKAPGKPKQTAQTARVPRSPVNRNSGLHPLLGADDIKYVLGVGAWSKSGNEENQADRHRAFVALIEKVAAAIEDEGLAACVCFYGRPDQVEAAREKLVGAPAGSNVALAFDGKPLTSRPAVQGWWRKWYESVSSERASVETAECLISGIVGPIPSTHAKIKGTSAIGGQSSGVSLMSFDKGAFRSYGWEQNTNSPVSADRAMAYVLALNHLLKPGGGHRKDYGGIAFLFWLREDSPLNPALMLEQQPSKAYIAEVESLLSAVTSASKSAFPDPDRFYLAGVSATGSRLILRTWLEETLPDAVKNVLGWWSGLEMQPLDNSEPPSTPIFWKLLYALEREGKPSAGRVNALYRRALEGSRRPLGPRFISDVLQRMRVDEEMRLNLAALGLLRLCLNDLHDATGQGESMPPALDPDHSNPNPAYICGQLLALHDSLQYSTFQMAKENAPNATVADRFYTLVMNSPAVGMAKVFELGRKHLTKMRRRSEGGSKLAFWFEDQIGLLEQNLPAQDIPHSFGQHDKARFALGFYHQKASRRKKSFAGQELDVSLDIVLPDSITEASFDTDNSFTA